LNVDEIYPREDLPKCLRKCIADPLSRSDLRRNWTELVKTFDYVFDALKVVSKNQIFID